MTKILIAYASRTGSTAEIAQAIAAQLETAGHHVDLQPCSAAPRRRGVRGGDDRQRALLRSVGEGGVDSTPRRPPRPWPLDRAGCSRAGRAATSPMRSWSEPRGRWRN